MGRTEAQVGLKVATARNGFSSRTFFLADFFSGRPVAAGIGKVVLGRSVSTTSFPTVALLIAQVVMTQGGMIQRIMARVVMAQVVMAPAVVAWDSPQRRSA